MFVYSTNGADGWDELDSIKEDILDLDGPGIYTIYRGETRKPDIANFIHADYLIEPVSDYLYYEYGEFSENFTSMIETDTDELRKDLIEVFQRHIERRGAKLDFYTVHSIEEVRVTVEEE
jgi:hypothetical protein